MLQSCKNKTLGYYGALMVIILSIQSDSYKICSADEMNKCIQFESYREYIFLILTANADVVITIQYSYSTDWVA